MSATTNPLVSVIVPAKNSAKLLAVFLDSCTKSEYTNIEILINDDVTSNDETPEVIRRFQDSLTIVYLKENTSMAQGRKVAALRAKGALLIHLDSDMQITPGLIGECVEKMQSGSYDALVIPEVSVGFSFWANVKALEKRLYQGVVHLESARVYRKEVYGELGGHDERMVFSEDKDLDIRLRAAHKRVGRTVHHLVHNEGSIRLYVTLKKKLGYSNTASIFAERHPREYAWQANPFNRYAIFVRNYRLLFTKPMLYLGVYYLKTLEYAFSFAGIQMQRMRALRRVGSISNARSD